MLHPLGHVGGTAQVWRALSRARRRQRRADISLTRPHTAPFSTPCRQVRKEHFKSVLLKKACRLMYGRMVAAKKLKPTILEFSGLPDLDDDARDRLFARADKMSLDLLKRIMDLLGVRGALARGWCGARAEGRVLPGLRRAWSVCAWMACGYG